MELKFLSWLIGEQSYLSNLVSKTRGGTDRSPEFIPPHTRLDRFDITAGKFLITMGFEFAIIELRLNAIFFFFFIFLFPTIDRGKDRLREFTDILSTIVPIELLSRVEAKVAVTLRRLPA